jgi:hypothetical protein
MTLESAFSQIPRNPFKDIGTAVQQTDTCYAAASVEDAAGFDDRAVVLRGTDDYMLSVCELEKLAFMPCSVLKGHQICIGTDEAIICFQGIDCEHGLDEYNDKILRTDTIGGFHCMGIENKTIAVFLFDVYAVGIDGIDYSIVYINDCHIISS